MKRKNRTENTKKIWLLYLLAIAWVGLCFEPSVGLVAAVDNPDPPASPVKLIFIHHSTGGNWLADPNGDGPYGGLGSAMMNNNYFVSATNYGWGPNGIGDRTDIVNWPEWFTGPDRDTITTAVYIETGQSFLGYGTWSRLAVDPGGQNEIIMFKSCFPNSNLYGSPLDSPLAEPNDWEYSVANAKAVYNNLLTYFTSRQDKLFIIITAPPLSVSDYPDDPDMSPAARAANARAFNNWLVLDWLSGYAHKNVAVFDYYNLLTSNGGTVDINDAGQSGGNHHRWWNSAIQHIQGLNNNFAAYPSGDSHPSSAGHQKATSEFVSLLNIYYHRWRSGLETPVLSVTPASRNVAKDAGATTFNVSNTGTGTMPWTAAVTSEGGWLSITSGASGTNTGTITCAFNANTGISARTGTIRVSETGSTGSSQNVTVIQAGSSQPALLIGSNSIGSRNTIKISDMSGTLPDGGGSITVSAWDVNGNALPESGGAAPLNLYNYETTGIAGTDLAARFPNGTPMLYRFSIESPKVVINNVKISTNDTFKIPIVYLHGMTNYTSNSIGDYNTIKISDISGMLPAGGDAITVSAWDINGNSLVESGSAVPLKLYNHGTTIISGSNLAARFPSGSPMIYAFDVLSAKVLITNVKNSTDGKLNIPVAYTRGVSNFVSNSIGNYNALEISDLSGTLSPGGCAISVKAWDTNGNALPESGSAAPLKLFNHGTTSISGSNLAARFPTGNPMTYDFSIESSKVLITNVKSSTDGLVEIPGIFTNGISNFATNYVSHLNTIKISDTSGTLTAGGVAISITAWDTNGNALPESGVAAPLKLYNLGTTSISGSDLAARFPSGLPVLYEFSTGSSNVIVTSLTASVDGTIKTPTVFTIGASGGV
jgi:hypothetical protein